MEMNFGRPKTLEVENLDPTPKAAESKEELVFQKQTPQARKLAI